MCDEDDEETDMEVIAIHLGWRRALVAFALDHERRPEKSVHSEYQAYLNKKSLPLH